MKPAAKNISRRGFTIVELLVVISIMAVVATLATGAVLKSVRQNRIKRIDMTQKSLETALMSYRSLNGEWPYKFDDPDTVGAGVDKNAASFAEKQSFTGKENAKVFKKVFEEVKKGRALLDTSSIMTRVSGGRMTVREALERGESDVPVGYPNPENQSEFKFFKVVYYFATDMLTVEK